MLWVAAENWPFLLLSALAGAGVSTFLTVRRTPDDPVE